MSTLFNVQDLNNLQVFMQRVNLQGNESMAHAELLIKIQQAKGELENPAPAPRAEPAVTEPPVPQPPSNGNGKRKAQQ